MAHPERRVHPNAALLSGRHFSAADRTAESAGKTSVSSGRLPRLCTSRFSRAALRKTIHPRSKSQSRHQSRRRLRSLPGCRRHFPRGYQKRCHSSFHRQALWQKPSHSRTRSQKAGSEIAANGCCCVPADLLGDRSVSGAGSPEFVAQLAEPCFALGWDWTSEVEED